MIAPAHLNALKAFEAAARHQSFAAAAAELNVSSAAVGQLVRSLEQSLGVPLFTRVTAGRQRLVLTEAALAALPDIRAGFDRLNSGVMKIRESGQQNVLTLTISPAFASKWLLPRMDSLSTRLPDTDLLLDTSHRLADFSSQKVDIGIRYGAGEWAGLVAEKLMDEAIFPVCAPALRRKLSLKTPSDLLDQTLIHDLTGDSAGGYVTWSAWFEAAGIKDAMVERGLRINNSAAVLQAAMDGQGVALARSVMACDDIAAGRLVKLFPEQQMSSRLAYWVVYKPQGKSKPMIASFLAWLQEEARNDCAASGKDI